MASSRKRRGEGQCKHRRGKRVSVGLCEIMCVKLLKVGRPTIELDFRGGSDSKESACNTGDPGSIPGSGRSPGEGMATHSSILIWKILWMEDPGRLQSMGSQRVGHD